ncbi:glycosyltransferase 87 family protein [Actinokineospora sp. PR83]|uniref:glycosyltransferase family 87 protein n=1 Tax=Actinokineospora sp. PR83 TaxID=2884908 RepID=UPI001F1BD77F|nr:glycosyltransferase 87 family protein [Actinokineospora sp. PR83]MCG8914428.1 glycosyltransferase 87 family protein [Actinokineospora sp. PR83]
MEQPPAGSGSGDEPTAPPGPSAPPRPERGSERPDQPAATTPRARALSPLKLAMVIAVLALGLAFGAKAPCLGTYVDDAGVSQLDWRDGSQYTRFCYSDTVPLYTFNRLAEGSLPYATGWVDVSSGKPKVRYMEYPVLTGLFMYLNANLTLGWEAVVGAEVPVIAYFGITAVLLALAWLAVVWASLRLTARRPRDALLVAASPLVVVHAFTNFDTLAVAAAVLALLAWARRRPVLAGVLLGVGGALKLFPLLLLGALLVPCLRAGRMAEFWTTAAAAVTTWVAVNAPIALLPQTAAGWGEFFRLNTTRDMDPDSIYYVLRTLTPWPGFDIPPFPPGEGPEVLNTVSLLLFLGMCLVIAYVGLSAPVRPRVAQLGFLIVAAFLLTNKVWSPQYSLWLVPLAVLALPRWKPLLAWMLVDAAVWFPRMLYFAGPPDGIPAEPFLHTVIVRDLALLLLCALVVREIRRPEFDRVRVGGAGDPIAGVTADEPDRWRLRGVRVVRPARPAPEEPAHVG